MTFSFKQFTICQDKCAMKVGTDAVLLGAWTPLTNNPAAILDIGTGTGIVALMLAQRSASAQVDALEIDENAYEQAVDNFENSPWADRLFCFHAGLDEFVDEPEQQYDLIVSNPPFYSENYFSADAQRDRARFTASLSFEDLIKSAALLLSETGIFSAIIPYKEEEKFVSIASRYHLHPIKITHVKGNPDAVVKRSLLAFSHQKERAFAPDELVIETVRHQYTEPYIALTKDFYLKM